MILCLEPAPSPLWPLAFLQDLEAEAGTFAVLSLSFEVDGAGATIHISDQDISDEDLDDSGSVLGNVLAWPDLTLGFDLRAPRLGLPQWVIDYDDSGGELEEVLKGLGAMVSANVAATIRIGSDGTPSGLWPTRWTGKLVDWMNGGENIVRLVLQHDHGWLTRPLVQHVFRASEFPYAHRDALFTEKGLPRPIPLAVGNLDSRGAPAGALYDNPYGWFYGAVPAFYIDTRAGEYRFTPALGYRTIPRVWLEDVLQVEGTDYDITHTTISGYGLTCIEFGSDPGDNPTVRCDLESLDSKGDGTGAPLLSPVSQLKHLLVQFGRSGGRGVGLASSDLLGNGAYGPLDPRSLAVVDDILQGARRFPRGSAVPNRWTHGRQTSAYFNNPALRNLDAINGWCHAFGAYPYWSEAGTLAFAVLDHRGRRTYHDGWHWIRDEDLVDGQITQFPSRVRPANQARSGQIIVNDPHGPLGSLNGSSESPAAEAIPNPWASGHVGQYDLVPYATTQDSGWTETGGGTDPHDSQAHPAYEPATAYSSWAAGTGTFRVRARLSEAPQVPQGLPVAVEIRFQAKTPSSGTIKGGVYIASTAYYDAAVGDITLTADWTDYTAAAFLTNPGTGPAAWLHEDIGPDLLQLIVSATGAAAVRGLRARVYALDGGPAAALVRERLSRELLLASRPPAITEAVVGMARGAIRPGDPFSISTTTVMAGVGPDEVALDGWGLEPEERRLHVLCSATWRLGAGEMVLRAVDAHSLLTPIWEHGIAQGLAPEAAGILRLGSWPAGAAHGPDGRLFSRPTADDGDPTGEDSITAPWGSSATIAAEHERYTSSGLHAKALNTTPNPDVSPDLLTYTWRHDNQPWPIDGGTAWFLVSLDALTAGQVYTVFRCGSFVLHAGIADDVVRFRNSVGGTDYDAEYDLTNAGVSAGNTFAVAIRWTPGIGGLTRLDADDNLEDVPPYALSLWVRPSDEAFRANDVTSAQGFPGDLNIGHDAGTNILRGHLKLWRAVPQALADAEIEAILEDLIQ